MQVLYHVAITLSATTTIIKPPLAHGTLVILIMVRRQRSSDTPSECTTRAQPAVTRTAAVREILYACVLRIEPSGATAEETKSHIVHDGRKSYFPSAGNRRLPPPRWSPNNNAKHAARRYTINADTESNGHLNTRIEYTL